MSQLEIGLRPISGSLGAEIIDVDPRYIDDATFDQVHTALLEHQVLFFRETRLTDEQHIALAERWGAIDSRCRTWRNSSAEGCCRPCC